MNAFVTRTSAGKKEEIDVNVAKFFFSENISFVAAEGDEFKKLCEVLRPGYKPPNRKIIGGRLLDHVYDEVIADTKEKMKAKDTVILTQDGWSSVTNDAVIAHSFYDGKTNYLLNVKDTGSNKKTAEYCFELLDEAISEIKDKYDKSVFGICTDNEAKMKKLRNLVKQKYPQVVVYGCSAHYANLLEDDVTNSQVMKHLIEIQKYFRNVHRAHGLLKEKGGCMPQIPNETRWNSSVDCLKTFIKNHSYYVSVKTDLLANNEDMPKNISNSVDNIGLLREAEHLLTHMNKFSTALDLFQSDQSHIGCAVKIWRDLLDDKDLAQYRSSVKKRYKEAVTEAHIIAYMTNPKHFKTWEEDLEETEIKSAEQWLRDISEDYDIELEKYKVLLDGDLYEEKMFSERSVSFQINILMFLLNVNGVASLDSSLS